MNLKYLKNIIKEGVYESFNEISDNNLVQSLLKDSNNEVVWRCFHSKDENSIFRNGYTAEYFGDGEGSLYGNGVYSFYKPFGAKKRCGTGGVGDKIMKCVILGGFKDFIILDSELAKKYYGSNNIMVQLEKFFGDKSKEIYSYCMQVKNQEGSDVGIMHGRTAPIARLVFGGLQGKYARDVIASNIRGIVYNGGNDPNANVLFNPREIVPIAVTNSKTIVGNDFTDWQYKLTTTTFENIEKVRDFYTYGETLKARGLIRDYVKNPPINDCLNVTLKNGRQSLYDIFKDKFVSEYGFDKCFGWDNITINGKNILLLPVQVNNNIFYIKENKRDGLYYFYYQKKDFQSVMTMEEHDYGKQSNRLVVESYNDVFVYHMTPKESCKAIFKQGFSAEYSNNEYYGHGVYNALYANDAANVLKSFGNYMIKSKLDNGLNNFFITIDSIAKQVYGKDSSLISQLKQLILPEFYDELVSKYGLSRLCSNQILNILDPNNNGGGDLGKTNIRGLVCKYHGGIPVVICRNWNGIIPDSYSNDGGRTWKQPNNDDLKNFIKQHSNAKIYIEKLISQGIIKDTFGGHKTSISANQQMVNGYVQVVLRKNNKVSFFSQEDNKLISEEGFDKGFAAEVMNIDGDNFIVIPVIDNGEKYFIYKEDDGRYQLYKEENVYKKLLSDDGLHMNTFIYDNIFLKR